MKIAKLTHVSLLITSLLVTAAAQAFCFTKGNNHGRSYDAYNYPGPSAGFMPQQYYTYPSSMAPINTWYGNRIPIMLPGPQGNGLYNGTRGRR